MNKSRAILITLFKIIIVLLMLKMCGCNGDEEECKEQGKKPKETTIKPHPPKTVNFYLDASKSMKGFVEKIQFRDVVDNCRSGFENDGVTTQIFHWGLKNQKYTENLVGIGEAFMPDKFTLLGNDYIDIFTKCSDLKKGEMNIVISDGILSPSEAKGYTLVQTKTEIQETLTEMNKRGDSFSIFLFQSPFKGEYYFSSNPNDKKMIENENRYFVVFVFHTPEQYETVQSMFETPPPVLSQTFGYPNQITFKENAPPNKLNSKKEKIFSLEGELTNLKVEQIKFESHQTSWKTKLEKNEFKFSPKKRSASGPDILYIENPLKAEWDSYLHGEDKNGNASFIEKRDSYDFGKIWRFVYLTSAIEQAYKGDRKGEQKFCIEKD